MKKHPDKEVLFHSNYLLYPERQPESGGTRQGPAQAGSLAPESVSAGSPPDPVQGAEPVIGGNEDQGTAIGRTVSANLATGANSDPGDCPPEQSPAIVPPQVPSSPFTTAPAPMCPASSPETANPYTPMAYGEDPLGSAAPYFTKSPPETAKPAPETANPDQVLHLIGRALNLKADPETLERLLGLQERIWAREAEMAFNAAKGRILKKLAGIKIVKSKSVLYENEKGKPARGFYEAFKYTPLEEIDRVLGPLLAEEEMDLSYSDEPMTDGRVMIRGRLKHLPGGHHEDSLMAAPLDTSGGKNNVQAVGSTNSYLRRYVTCNLFNLVIAGDDDDGRSAEPLLPEQVKELLGLINKAKVGASFAKYMNWPVTEGRPWSSIVSAAPRSDYRKAKVTLEEHLAKQGAQP